MGYSTSEAAVERIKPILDLIIENENRVDIPAERPDSLAFKIRQGIFSAQANEIEPYASLNVRILVRPSMVIVEPKADLAGVDTDGLRVRRIGAPMTKYELIVYLKSHKIAVGQEIIFTHFQGKPDGVTTWATENGFQVLNTNPLHFVRAE